MQAIITRYHGPTNSRGSRIVAHCEGGRYTHPVDDETTIDANYRNAALELARRLGWEGEWIAADTRDSRIWVNLQAANDINNSFTVEPEQ